MIAIRGVESLLDKREGGRVGHCSIKGGGGGGGEKLKKKRRRIGGQGSKLCDVVSTGQSAKNREELSQYIIRERGGRHV